MKALSKTSITAGIATLALATSLFAGVTIATAAPVDQGAFAQGSARCTHLFQQAGTHLSGTCDTVRGNFVDIDGDGVCDNIGADNGAGNGWGSSNSSGNFVNEDGDSICDDANSENGQSQEGYHGSSNGNGGGHNQGAGAHHGRA